MDPLTEKPERIAFIGYNIGIYESIQKFASLILSGKINTSLDTNKIAQLLSETVTFYDADMISQLINLLVGSNAKTPIGRVDANEVSYVINQLKACGVSLLIWPALFEASSSAEPKNFFLTLEMVLGDTWHSFIICG
jgi:hypothetical protein